MAIHIVAPPQLAAQTLQWGDVSHGAQLTVIVKTTFALNALGLAQSVTPEPITERDLVPVKAGADVTVTGQTRQQDERVLVGVAVARGTEVLWGRLTVASALPDEPALIGLDGSAATLGPSERETLGPSEHAAYADAAIDDEDDLSRFNSAPSDQRMVPLRGGEQLLLVGLGRRDVMSRLPALAAHAVFETALGQESVPLIGDTLHIDTERMIATVTWRGHVPWPGDDGTLKVALLPLVEVEEVLGQPPSWTRTARRPTPDKPVILDPIDIPATTLRATQTVVPIIAKASFDLVNGQAATLAETQDPLTGDKHHNGNPDESLLYASDLSPVKREVDVVASGFIYSRNGAAVVTSRLLLGTIDKRIVAVGERQWRGGHLSEPASFERIALRHELAFGGPDISDNPLGTGATGTKPPNLERPDELMRSPSDRPRSACFAPLPRTFALRDGGGTFDARWLEERWPSWPDDYNMSAFNAAPADQRCAVLRGDESYSLSAVRPDGAGLEGSLPGVHPWCFAQNRRGTVEPVNMMLDTVAFDCERCSLVLVWRGSITVANGDVKEIPRIWLTLCGLDDEPALPQAWGRLHTSKDMRFTAESVQIPTTLRAVRDQLRDVERAIAALMKPARRMIPEPQPVPRARLQAWLEADQLAGRDLTGADLRGLDLSGRDLTRCILSGAMLDNTRFDGATCAELNLGGSSAKASSWVGADLTRADMSHASLEGADLAGAVLDQANLANAVLNGATLRLARLTRADLSHASLIDVQLEEAALDRADLSHTTLDRASFRGASLDNAKLYDAGGAQVVLDDASLKNARLEGVRLPQASACNIKASGSMWDRADLTGARMLQADLNKASFNGALLDNAVLNQADLRRARMRGASLQNALFLKADLMESDLEGADLRGADLRGANLYRAGTWKANLKGARLELAHTAGSRLAPS